MIRFILDNDQKPAVVKCNNKQTTRVHLTCITCPVMISHSQHNTVYSISVFPSVHCTGQDMGYHSALRPGSSLWMLSISEYLYPISCPNFLQIKLGACVCMCVSRYKDRSKTVKGFNTVCSRPFVFSLGVSDRFLQEF